MDFEALISRFPGKRPEEASDRTEGVGRTRKAAMRTAAGLSLALLASNAGYSLLPRSQQALVYVPLAAAAAAGLLVLAWRGWKVSFSSMGIASEGVPRSAILGAAFGLGVTVFLLAGLLLVRGMRAPTTYLDGGYGLYDPWYRVLVRIPLGTVLLEEVAFRGVLMALLRAGGAGPVKAIMVSSGVFGLWHLSGPVALLSGYPSPDLWSAVVAFAGVPVGFLGGILFATLRVKTGSLAGPMVAHWVINASATLLFAAVMAM
ncbi:MAG: CPBP family intramembrane metalloprotease [Chloroflexi bacterium]|nr:CPBP family intramembrane metalloprotease [Chloroflexota bacterium]